MKDNLFFPTKYIFLLILIHCLYACQKSTTNVDFDLLADKRMVLYAELSPNQPVIAHLSASLNTTNQSFSFKELAIRDAMVLLIADNEIVEQLNFNEDLLAYTTSSTIIADDKSYILRVEHPNFTTIESEPVNTPSNFENLLIDTLRPTNIACFHELPKQFNVVFDNPITPSYYQFEVSNLWCIEPIISQNGTCANNIINMDDGQPLFGNNCVLDDIVDIQIISGVNRNDGFSEQQVSFSLQSVSESKYLFEKSLSNADSFDEGFVEPRQTYSNIKNGFGVVFSSREMVIMF